MSDENKSVIAEEAELEVRESIELDGAERAQAYMNRQFCSTRERVAYVLKCTAANLSMGKYDLNSDWYLYDIFGLQPTALAKAQVGLGIYDMINDPLSAWIIDNMRSRWGKFKPFQFLSIIPNFIIGIFSCLLPIIASAGGFSDVKKLWVYMAVAYIGETVNAFVGGGGYIDNVFTPNPNERTALLTASKFVGEFFAKFPEQVAALVLDLIDNGQLDMSVVKTFVVMKTFWWLVSNVPNIWWAIVSKERVPQSKKPPNPIHGFMSVFKNKPLLIYTLTGVIDGINIGTSETLYYSDVLHFKSFNTVAGIPGSPMSYASYAIAPKLRKKHSTKGLWLMQRGSVLISEAMFMLVGFIGGKKNGLYKKVIPMLITFAACNMLEMYFYATKKIVGSEINYEVLDYCEWKNGYRVEATINMMTGYFGKVQGIILRVVNAWLLEKWAGFQYGGGVEQTDDAKWKMFIATYAPHLIFDFLSIIPMFFYNIDKKTRDQMYLDLEKSRADTAAKEMAEMQKTAVEGENAENNAE